MVALNPPIDINNYIDRIEFIDKFNDILIVTLNLLIALSINNRSVF